MYNTKVHSIFHNLEKQTSNISEEINNFMGNISEWADELVKIVEKEFKTSKESALFLLPKTPSEKKTRNRKGRNALVSKCSVINSTFLHNEMTNLDETISSRTRGAKRAATSKMSQLDVTKDLHVAQQETVITTEDTTREVSDVTFVLPKASTRTKPILRNTEPEATLPDPKTLEPELTGPKLSNTSNKSPEKESSQKKISQTVSSSPERLSKHKISRTPSNGSGEDLDKTPVVITETPVQNEKLSRRKISRTLSKSPVERQSSRKIFRSLSGSPIVRSSSVIVPKSPSKSPVVRSSSLKSTRTVSRSPAKRSSRNSRNSSGNNGGNLTRSQHLKASTPEMHDSRGNRTVTIKKEPNPSAASTFVVTDETLLNDEEGTPVVKEGRFFRLSKTSTPAIVVDKTRLTHVETGRHLDVNVNSEDVTEEMATANGSGSGSAEENIAEEVTQDAEIPKKKRKLKKDEEVKENIEEMADTVRITRTKSKALKQMMEENENKQADLSAFAKKLINRAKMTSVKKNQLAALLENNSSTPTNGPGLGNSLPFGNLTTSKSKYHLLLSSSKKLKTPLATLPNSAMKIATASGDKNRSKPKVASRDSSVENAIRSTVKSAKKDLDREVKLKSKKEKEEEAVLKRQNVIKSKQEELKRKNELKHQMAMKQREKLEQEKYYNMIQSEKEKEERHKLILQERQMKLKEEAFKKKMMTQQKIAETVERRRMEEEARIAKLKEMEAEEQRLALEKQKEQERQEKRAQERLAQKKAREEYEMQLKQELEAERLRAEKLLTAKKCMASASKMQSASKKQKLGPLGERREWDYKPRNENDYGLEDEHSEVDSEDEKSYDKTKPAVPWGKKILQGKSPVVKVLTLEMLCEFMPCYQKTPDIHKMFKMTPSKRLKRTSSAIWNTPSS